MNISVIICTHNRSESLQRTLESMCKMVVPDKLDWELIVVDNNSTDNTKETISSFQQVCHFDIRYVFEKKQGLSFARNLGVTEANGEIIAFTDDDVLVDKNWIKNISAIFEKYDVACVGGKILPIWERKKPNWLTEELYANLALLDYGGSIIQLNVPKLWGANLIIKKSMFEKYGKFDVSLGRMPDKLFGSEETTFLKILIENNEKLLYVPDILVHHYIPKERMVKKYFRKWRFDNGEKTGHMMGDYQYRNFLNVPLYVYNDTIKIFLKYAKAVISSDSNCFLKELDTLQYLGFINGRIKMKYGKK